MNAIPQKAHNYQRVRTPQTPALERTRPLAKIESLDERRSAKLSALKAKQQKLEQQRKYDDVEMYYAMKRYSAQGSKKSGQAAAQNNAAVARSSTPEFQRLPIQNTVGPRLVARKEERPARKLTSAYEVMPRNYNNRRDNNYKANADGTLAARQMAGVSAAENDTERARHVAVETRPPKRKGVVSTILCIAVVFMMLSGLLVKYAQISELTYQNSMTDKSILTLQQEKDKLEMEKALRQDLGAIQTRAKELGMAQPSADQIIYLPAGALSADDIIQGESVLDEKTGMPIAVEDDTASTVTITEEGTGSGVAEKRKNAGGLMENITSLFQGIASAMTEMF